jgi:hypothetical protein
MLSPAARQERLAVVPALIAAAVSLFLIRSGFVLLFFLAPFGFMGFRYNAKSAWTCFGLAAVANSLFVLGTVLARNAPAGEMLWDIVYFTAMSAVFTWATVPVQNGGRPFRIAGAYRLIIGSAFCSALFIGLFFRAVEDQVFYAVLKRQVEAVTSLYTPRTSDVVQNALLESLTPEIILDAMKDIILRGGAVVSSALIFAVNRQLSLIANRLSGGTYRGGSLSAFHAHPRLIWVLSVSLALIVGTRALEWVWPEIIAWNILVLCTVLYLAQGLGILQYFLARPATPFFVRLLLPIVFIVLVFSPGLNAVLVGVVVLLGIAENWALFRAPKKDGPPSTPEA